MSQFETISEFDRRVRANYTINLCLGIRRRPHPPDFLKHPPKRWLRPDAQGSIRVQEGQKARLV